MGAWNPGKPEQVDHYLLVKENCYVETHVK